MRTLAAPPLFSRLIVAWFALALGILSAWPLSFPKTFEVVCTAASGVKVIVTTPDGQADPAHHSVDCPMCLGMALPLPEVPTLLTHHQPLSHALKPAVAAHIAALIGAPLPARGPPSAA